MLTASNACTTYREYSAMVGLVEIEERCYIKLPRLADVDGASLLEADLNAIDLLEQT